MRPIRISSRARSSQEGFARLKTLLTSDAKRGRIIGVRPRRFPWAVGGYAVLLRALDIQLFGDLEMVLAWAQDRETVRNTPQRWRLALLAVQRLS